MPKLILKFDDRELQECAVGLHAVTIGRRPDNVLVIDNAAVSGRHARVYREGESYVVEDLKSTNGTFIDNKPITRHTLRDGDAMIVGKHIVLFSMAGGEDAPGLDSGGPAKITTAPPAAAKTERATAPSHIGTLKVLSGKSTERHYTLSAHTSIIGKADTAMVRLSGWFKPKMAAAIARKGDGYSVTAHGGKVKINGQPLVGRRDLKDGDIVEVSGLTLEFRQKSTRPT